MQVNVLMNIVSSAEAAGLDLEITYDAGLVAMAMERSKTVPGDRTVRASMNIHADGTGLSGDLQRFTAACKAHGERA